MTHLEIEAFFEIMKKGSVSAAAASLYVTQPAMSRRLKALEEELGYALFERKKGQRNCSLTACGEAFVPIAKKWQMLFHEAQEVQQIQQRKVRRIAAVGSVSTYILPSVLRKFYFKQEGSQLCFHNYHSYEAYQFVDEGLIDIAYISDDMYHKRVETIPAFKEEMVLLTHLQFPSAFFHPSMLKPEKEIRLPWNPEYDSWHGFWFGETAAYALSLDQMSLLEEFLTLKDVWAITPASVAYHITKKIKLFTYRLLEGPSPRILYYLKSERKDSEWIQDFNHLLHEEIKSIPNLESFLK